MAPSFKQLDLNLLRVFAAVMEERSALRASRLLCTSQSAVSHALARLRDQLGDDLFLRTRRGLKPTARALELAPEIVAALAIVRTAVERQEFDPATSDRTFTLAASDALSILTVQNLLREFGRSAPGVSLVVKPGTRVDLGEMIDLGRIDVALGSFSEWPEHMRFDPMAAAYRDVLISPIGSTPIERSDQLHSRRLAVVSVGGEEEGAIGGFIYERGLGRRTEMYDKAALERAFRNCGDTPSIVGHPPCAAIARACRGGKSHRHHSTPARRTFLQDPSSKARQTSLSLCLTADRHDLAPAIRQG
ncbi:LysR family transcriptional regulator [Caballeronia sp. CLC5]|uniref:LysR family transcriptional regulator n=1 Tax=Caballeronia sp. CLC5 TaxID=2906764 RepID=UPI001F2AF360|nr:LysR family transcriptional regulator [Caballeronia sp. CLC5]MCE4570471.1 LysR family transcriptional regulator [Caballeronia sp. CLC5]